jgi:hypothetical protein
MEVCAVVPAFAAALEAPVTGAPSVPPAPRDAQTPRKPKATEPTRAQLLAAALKTCHRMPQVAGDMHAKQGPANATRLSRRLTKLKDPRRGHSPH